MLIRAVINVVGIVVFVALVSYLAGHQLVQPVETALTIAGVLWIYPLAAAGGWLLDRGQGVERARLVTTDD